MHNSISKKLLAGALSVMMVLSLVAPSGAQAASSYSLKQKSGLSKLTADKTYTYYVKGVKKTQYIKVARTYKDVVVKKGSTTVKKSTKIKGTGKTITLKLTAPDKVKNYKNTLKVKVYNKKTNKLVKTLKKTATIKVKALKINSVETATSEDNGSVKYLNVTFNKALDSLDASEVSIRDAATSQLFTVKEVELAKNGKTAVITLLGNDQAGTTHYLLKLRDYVLKVTKDSVSAELKFNVPEVESNVVTAIDKTNKTITVNGTKLYVNGQTVDYDALLGATVNVKYDVDQKLIDLTEADQKIVYGTFYVAKEKNADDSYTLTDANNDKVTYNTQATTIGSNKATVAYKYGKQKNSIVNGATVASKADDYYMYAKVVLNNNGTIKRIIEMPAMSSVLVKSVKDNFVVNYDKTDVNLKDWTIVKDNKVVEIKDIAENDMLYTTTGSEKIAVVYNNTIKSAISNVYTDRFVAGDKSVKYANITHKLYIDGKAQTADEEHFLVAKAGGEATLYLSFEGNVDYVTGTEGKVTTTTKPYIITQTFSAGTIAGDDMVWGYINDGNGAVKVNVPAAQLVEVKAGAITAKASNAATKQLSIGNLTSGAATATTKITDGTNDIDISTAGTNVFAAGNLVLVTTNASGQITKLNVPAKTAITAPAAGLDLRNIPSVGGLLTSKDTPVYDVDGTTVKVTTLGECGIVIQNGNSAATYAVNGIDDDNTKADYIVVAKADKATASTSVATTKQVIVKDVKMFTNADGNTEVASIDAVDVASGEVVTYTKFENATSNKLTGLVKKGVYTFGFDKNEKLVVTDATYNLTREDSTLDVKMSTVAITSTTATFDGLTVVKRHSDVDHESAVYFIDSDGVYNKISWTALADKVKDGKTFATATYSKYQGVTNVVDVLVVAEGTSAYDAALATLNAMTTASFTAAPTYTQNAGGAAVPASADATAAVLSGYTITVATVTMNTDVDADGKVDSGDKVNITCHVVHALTGASKDFTWIGITAQ